MATATGSFNATEFLLHREWKDERPVVLGVSSAMSVLATICFALRVWQRNVRNVKFGWDDGFLVSSFIFIWILDAILACNVIYGGVGTDIVANALRDPSSVGRFVKFIYVLKCVVPTAMTLTKLGILAMYMRIFPTPFIKTSCRILAAFVIAFWLSVIFPSLFTCTPIRKTWDPYVEGYCNHATDDWVAWADGIPEFVSCVVIFALPIYEVWRLGASLRTKLAISAVFMVASLSVVASTVRFVLGYQEHATKSEHDKEGFNMNGAAHVAMVLTWSHVEVCTGFIAACLPALRPLAVQVLQKVGLLKKREELPQPEMSVPTFGRAGARRLGGSEDTELGLPEDQIASETYHAKVDLPYNLPGEFPRGKIHGEEVESEDSGSSTRKGSK